MRVFLELEVRTDFPTLARNGKSLGTSQDSSGPALGVLGQRMHVGVAFPPSGDFVATVKDSV